MMKKMIFGLVVMVSAFEPVHLVPSKGFQRIPAYFPSSWDSSMTDAQIQQKAASEGLYTTWISSDNPMGTGDFENVKKLVTANTPTNCPMKCAEPVGVEWDLVNTANQARIDQCLVLYPQDFARIATRTYPGFNCLNAFQMRSTCPASECQAIGMKSASKRNSGCDLCPNFKVRYVCPTNSQACPQTRSLEAEMEELDTLMANKERELEELNERALNEQTRSLEVESTNDEETKLQSLLKELIELGGK